MKPLSLLVSGGMVAAVIALTIWLGFSLNSWAVLLWLVGLAIGGVVVLLDDHFGMEWYQPLENVPLTRSSLFVVVLCVLSIYILTTSTNVLGHGVVIGLWTVRGLTMLLHAGETETQPPWLPFWDRVGLVGELERVAVVGSSFLVILLLLLSTWI